MIASDCTKPGQRRAETGGLLSRKDRLLADIVLGEKLRGQVKLLARGMEGQRPHKARQGVGDAAVAGDLRRAGIATAGKDHRRKLEKKRRGLAGITLQIVQARHRVVIEVEAAGLDDGVEGLTRETKGFDGSHERPADGMAGAIAMNGVAPELQTDLAKPRLAHDIAQPGDFDIEGVERQKMLPCRFGREQIREIAVAVVVPNDLGSVIVIIHAGDMEASARSVHGEEGRGDSTLLGKQDVEGPNRRAGIHDIDDDRRLAQMLAERRRKRHEVGTRPDQKDFDLRGFLENALQRLFGQRLRAGPAINAARQAEKIAAMRHAREAEAAIPISIDPRPTGKMGIADDNALPAHLAGSAALVSGGATVEGRRLK